MMLRGPRLAWAPQHEECKAAGVADGLLWPRRSTVALTLRRERKRPSKGEGGGRAPWLVPGCFEARPLAGHLSMRGAR